MKRIYGYPGDGINGVMGALGRAADLNLVTWEQRVLAGDPKFEDSQELPDISYASFAESLGLVGVTVDRPEDVGSAWDRVLTAGRPALLEAVVDPNVPPLPPHIS